MNRNATSLVLCLTLVTLTSCAVGPDYQKPSVPLASSFKELGAWSKAEPRDDMDRGAWWSFYRDPVLDDLERQVDVSNQNLKASEAAFRQAKALSDEAWAGLFPTLSLGANDTRSGSLASGNKPVTKYDWNATASWELDVWGRIRRTIENQEDLADASQADLASARLSAQATLATDYFDLRVQDEVERLLQATVAADQNIYDIVKHQYEAGTAAKSDLLASATQLESVQSTAMNADIKRRQLEHAIAVLIGKAPSDFSLSAAPLNFHIPEIPVALPSQLLERRPDIASSERKVAAANAEIGVAEAAWFPTLSLSASFGANANALSKLFQTSNQIWSLGPSVAETVFDAGSRSAAVTAAEAGYDQTVANYRQTVLTSFQQVEDQLAALNILDNQSKVLNQAVHDAEESQKLTLNQYKEGIVAYNVVLTSQTVSLSNQQSELVATASRLDASVALIEALGGGWSRQDEANPAKTSDATPDVKVDNANSDINKN